jgi:hypothetical protein
MLLRVGDCYVSPRQAAHKITAPPKQIVELMADTKHPDWLARVTTMGTHRFREISMSMTRTLTPVWRERAKGKRVNDDVEAAVRPSLGQGVGIGRTANAVGVGVATVQRIKQAMARP